MAAGAWDAPCACLTMAGTGPATMSKEAVRRWPVIEQQSVPFAPPLDSRGPWVVEEAVRGQQACAAGVDLGAKHSLKQGPPKPTT